MSPLLHGSAARRRPRPGASVTRTEPAEPSLGDALLGLQEAAGNAAVAGILGRVPARGLQRDAGGAPPVVAPPVAGGGAPPPPSRETLRAFKTEAEIEALTLAEFHSHAESQADWALGPDITEAGKKKLRALLEFARSEAPAHPVLASCGHFNVALLLGTSLTADVRGALRTYSRAQKFAGTSVDVELAPDLPKALHWGQALEKLEKTPGKAIINTTIKQGPEGTQLQDLIDAGAIDDFIRYVKAAKPLLMATNGTEIDSYLTLRKTKDPASYVGRIAHVHNYHRFESEGLEALVTNEADTSKAKPLTLVLHSSIDHNGAFHHDPFMTAMLKDAHNVTIMIEGAANLAAIQGLVKPLAKKYGRGDKIEQLHIAGHGDSAGVELAAHRDASGGIADEGLKVGDKATENLLKTLLDNMSSSPDARIVLNACLTASREVHDELDPDPKKARGQLTAALGGGESMAEMLRRMAAARGIAGGQVLAANASFAQVELIDPGTGRLKLADPDDPALTAADKLEYIRTGSEPEGAMRAVVVVWPTDQPGVTKAMGEHVKAPLARDIWNERVTRAMFEISLKDPSNVSVMNQLANAARGVGELKFPDERRVEHLNVPKPLREPLFSKLEHAPDWKGEASIRLVVLQVWLEAVAAKQPAFVDELKGFTVKVATPYVDLLLLQPLMGALLAHAPREGALRLALLDAATNHDGATEATKIYLRGVRGPRANFANPAEINTALGGLGTVDEIEAAIKEPDPAAAAPAGVAPAGPAPLPDFNVDLDGDGTNDFYVEPLTRTGAVAATWLNVREKPGTGERRVDAAPAGTRVIVIGSSGDWYAIEWGGRVRFVHKSWVRLGATP